MDTMQQDLDKIAAGNIGMSDGQTHARLLALEQRMAAMELKTAQLGATDQFSGVMLATLPDSLRTPEAMDKYRKRNTKIVTVVFVVATIIFIISVAS